MDLHQILMYFFFSSLYLLSKQLQEKCMLQPLEINCTLKMKYCI